VISELKRQGAKIDIWGVGTNLVTGGRQSALDGVFKLSALHDDQGAWKYTLKLSEQLVKVSNPGILQVRRYRKKSANGINVGDVIYDEMTGINYQVSAVDPFDPTKQQTFSEELYYQDLLVPIFDRGKRVYAPPSLMEIRERTQRELACLPVGMKRFLNPQTYFVGMEERLYDIKSHLVSDIRKRCT
jgi:nicotinate phosphoribosyltransferase